MRSLSLLATLLVLGALALLVEPAQAAGWSQAPFRPPKRTLHQDTKKTHAVAPPGVKLPSAKIVGKRSVRFARTRACLCCIVSCPFAAIPSDCAVCALSQSAWDAAAEHADQERA